VFSTTYHGRGEADAIAARFKAAHGIEAPAPAPRAQHTSTEAARRMSGTELAKLAKQGDPVAKAELARRLATKTAPSGDNFNYAWGIPMRSSRPDRPSVSRGDGLPRFPGERTRRKPRTP
jgi:hypothetical protein